MSLANQQYIQQCSGVLIVFVCATTVSINTKPEIAYDIAGGLKGIWVFAEVMLFTLTGTSLTFNNSNGPLYGERGLSPVNMTNILGVIVAGWVGRWIALGISMLIIYPAFPPHRQNKEYILPFWLNLCIFQLPKATVQATMGMNNI